ncbi:hypothetical protein HDU83_004388 [Entophlyctis luteolus]|nr:hypothetical protein HDU83_004388 [Entophlyctis luteolus]
MPNVDDDSINLADDADDTEETGFSSDSVVDRASKRQRRAKTDPEAAAGIAGLYLETVQRHILDFDFEALCSVSLSPLNVYSCLGRGKSSHAFTHALAIDHHIFINLSTLKVYCLPEEYEVTDPSLTDIKYAIRPFYSPLQIAALDSSNSYSYDLNNKPYLPGFVGLNNIKANDYINVIIQALAHVKPLRNFLMNDEEIDVVNGIICKAKLMPNGMRKKSSELANRFAAIVRKMWNPKAFKGQVSPHELLQEITNASGRQFSLTAQSDPAEFLAWILNALHVGLGGNPKKNGTSVIHQAFQGEVKVESQAVSADAGNQSFVPMFDIRKGNLSLLVIEFVVDNSSVLRINNDEVTVSLFNA